MHLQIEAMSRLHSVMVDTETPLNRILLIIKVLWQLTVG